MIKNTWEGMLPDMSIIHPISFSTGNGFRLEKEFCVRRFLGKGAYGSVFEVKSKLDGESYAIKIIIKKYA